MTIPPQGNRAIVMDDGPEQNGTVTSDASELSPLMGNGPEKDSPEKGDERIVLCSSGLYSVLAACAIAMLFVIARVKLGMVSPDDTMAKVDRAGAMPAVRFRYDSFLANDNHPLEAMASRMDDLDRRVRKVDQAVQLLLRRLTGQEDELHMLEQDVVLDHGKDSVLGMLQEDIQHLTRDSLISQTKLRNLTCQVREVEGKVRKEMENVSGLQATISQVQHQALETQSKLGALQSYVEAFITTNITVTFDDLPSNCSGEIENGYKGLTWTNVRYGDPVRCGWNAGRSDVVSSPTVIYNQNQDLAAMIASTDARDIISLFSLYATADWSDGLSLVIEGYRNGNLVAAKTEILWSTSPTRVDFDSSFHGLDHFTFVGHGGSVPDRQQAILDDVSLAITKT